MGIQHKHKCKERSKSRIRSRNRDNMDCRHIFIVLILVVVVNSKAVERRDEEGRLFGESMVEVVQRLVRDVNVLKTDNINLKKDSEGLKKDNSVLKAEVSRLKANGHSQYSVADQQWQSLHMAAAAACRASTAFGGHGPYDNRVYPRTKGHTCDQVCKATKIRTECDASLSIMGNMGRMKSVNQAVGAFYNYHCNMPGYAAHEEGVQD